MGRDGWEVRPGQEQELGKWWLNRGKGWRRNKKSFLLDVEVADRFDFLRGFWSLSSESASDQVSLESGPAALHGCALGSLFLVYCVC